MNERKTPWSIKGVADDAREGARAAAEAGGLTVGAWLDLAIRNAAGRKLGASDGSGEGKTEQAGDGPVAPAPPADGIPGSQTKLAIRRYQQDLGLNVTG
ncbi:MAG: peptidoglycan-binding protein [Alphaproteobacteria bacterium]|nr:peptidoglycan-binding protein [Alphaproteobacteria bacterium]